MNPSRNELCSCGSGKRYKHCCGGIIPIHIAAPAVPMMPLARRASRAHRSNVVAIDLPGLQQVPETTRSCGPCTACCDGWLTGFVRGHEMKPGVACHFRGHGCCTIYDERPEHPCRIFFCAWRLQGNPFPEGFRPDRLGVIILVHEWRDRPAYQLQPAGRDPDASAIKWMQEYNAATGIPFLFVLDGQQHVVGSPEFQQDMRDRATRGEPLF